METPSATDNLDAQLDFGTNAMIEEALERAKHEPAPITALSVHFNTELCPLIVRFSTGQRLAIPQEDLQYLATASVEDAAEVTIEMFGRAIHWENSILTSPWTDCWQEDGGARLG